MKDLIQLLKDPTYLGFIALAIVGIIYLIKTAFEFWKSTVLPLAYHRRLEQKKIILPSAKKVLDSDWKKSAFFRDGDPKLVDFQDQRIYRRPELEALKSRLNKGRFAHIEGPPSCGKTVLALNLSYEYLQNKMEVLYFSRPSTLTDSFFGFLATPTSSRLLDRSEVLIIVDDVHLDVAICSRLFSFLYNNYDKCKLLYVSRTLQMEYDMDIDPWQFSFTKYMPNIDIRSDSIVVPLAKFFSERKFGKQIPPAVLKAFISECGSDLLILGRYLREWDGSSSVHLGSIRERVFNTVQSDLALLRHKIPDAIKIILVLGVFYRFEVPVEKRFCESECDFEVDSLIKTGEIREQNGFLMLHHSSLAKLYTNAIQSLNMQEYAELSRTFYPFPHALFKAYILCNPRNLCELLVGLRRTRETIPELLKNSSTRLAVKNGLEQERDLSFLGWAMLVMYVADKENSWSILKDTDIKKSANELASISSPEDISLFLFNLSKVSQTKGREWVNGIKPKIMANAIESMPLRNLVRELIRIKEFSPTYFLSLVSTMNLTVIVEKILQEENIQKLKWSLLRLGQILGERFCVKSYAFPDFLGEWSTRLSVYCENARIVRFLPGRRLGIPFSQSTRQNFRYWQWLIGNVKKDCKITLDDGAVDAVSRRNSLFPVGIKNVVGEFNTGDIIELENDKNVVIGAGVSNFSSGELKEIMGLKSELISENTQIPPNRVMDNDLIVAGKRYVKLVHS